MGLIIKNGLVVTEEGSSKLDILIENEKISKIQEKIEGNIEDEIIDASGKIVIPGVIDAHVHYYMKTAKGRTIDNYETGTTCAAFGGITTFIDYATPIEGKSFLESLKIRQGEAEGHSFLDYNFHMEVTGDFQQNFNELKELKDYGIKSLKIYTTYGTTELPEKKIPELLGKAKEYGMLVTVHAEDDRTVKEVKEAFISQGKVLPQYHGDSRPNEAEVIAIKKLLGMAKEVDTPIYIVHVSTGEGAQIIDSAKKMGQKVYGETCPHYLLLTDQCYKGEEPQKYIMTPPLRKEQDQEVLWNALKDGVLQCVTTDHCSFHIKDKLNSKTCFEAIPGIGGSETLLPLIYSEGVGKGRISLTKLVELLSTNPSKIFGLYPQKGTIKVGSDGDIVIIDPEKEVVLKGNELHSAAEYTVFEGYKLKGYPIATILRGNVICNEGNWLASNPKGRFVEGKEIIYPINQ